MTDKAARHAKVIAVQLCIASAKFHLPLIQRSQTDTNLNIVFRIIQSNHFRLFSKTASNHSEAVGLP